MPLPPDEATCPKSFSIDSCCCPPVPDGTEFLLMEPIAEGNGVGETSAIELLVAFLLPFRDVLS